MSVFMGVNNDRFVVFDDQGDIQSIGRYEDAAYNNLKVDFEQVRNLVEGRESLFNFKVEYDFIEKRYVLKNKHDHEQDQLKESFLYEIPYTKSQTEVKIIKDNVNQVWKLLIDPKILEGIQTGSLHADPRDQYYSVTRKYNANFLHRVLKFDETSEIPFEYNFEFDNIPTSVYTVRKFSTYSIEVIDE
jgi:hypothetical protein